MPRFFFHLRNAGRELTDNDGAVIASAALAREQAAQAVQDFVQPHSGTVDPDWRNWSISLCDEKGQCVFAMDFGAAAALPHRGSVSVLEAPPSAKVSYLDAERRQRAFASLEAQLHHLRERTSMLRDQNRYATKHVQVLINALQCTRERSRELLARSRQQSQATQPWGEPSPG
jgi:hypothetical protein